MGKHTISSKARCYCYRSEGPQIVYCGINITTVHRVFDRKSDAKEFKERYCRSNYEDCPIFRMLAGDSNE